MTPTKSTYVVKRAATRVASQPLQHSPVAHSRRARDRARVVRVEGDQPTRAVKVRTSSEHLHVWHARLKQARGEGRVHQRPVVCNHPSQYTTTYVRKEKKKG